MKRSLSTSLIATAVALVVVTSLLIGTVVVISLRAYLRDQLAHEVRNSLMRAERGEPLDQMGLMPGPPGGPMDGHHAGADGPGGPMADIRGQQVGTLTAYVDSQGSLQGHLISDSSMGLTTQVALSAHQLRQLQQHLGTRKVTDVHLPHLGSYLVAAGDDGERVVLVGLPTRNIDEVVRAIVVAEALLVVLGAGLALLVGRLLVRRQLAPLRDVAATADRVSRLPLASGDVMLAERVRTDLADGHTEVGQVGAALNTMLDHVQESLETRERSERQVRQFVADASHELRTPLATITGYAELARRRPDDHAAVSTALSKVEAESGRMGALVEDLLLLARLDQGRPLARESVDLTHLLLEAVSDARVLAPGHHWRLDLPEQPLEVTGDGLRLHQLVSNLLTNARKYTPSGTTITVRARPTWLEVHDDGPGLDAELAQHAFDRFSRGEQSRTRQGEDPGGHGLGLALVKAIAEAHGGSVAVTSRPGDTTFRVVLEAESITPQ